SLLVDEVRIGAGAGRRAHARASAAELYAISVRIRKELRPGLFARECEQEPPLPRREIRFSGDFLSFNEQHRIEAFERRLGVLSRKQERSPQNQVHVTHSATKASDRGTPPCARAASRQRRPHWLVEEPRSRM